MSNDNAKSFRLDHVGISVTDLDWFLNWYGEAFGLKFQRHLVLNAPLTRGAIMLHPTGWRLELFERQGAVPSERESSPSGQHAVLGYSHLCVRVENIDDVYKSLIAMGATPRIDPQPGRSNPDSRLAYLADPDGNLIELLQY